MDLWLVAKRELKLGFRNPWFYSFLVLVLLFSLSLLLISSRFATGLGTYTHTTGTMLNLMIYLLPLMALLLGSLAIAAEKEDGGWQLLATYPLSTFSFLTGKFLGLFLVLCTVVGLGLGLTGVCSAFLSAGFNLRTTLVLYACSFMLIALFLGLAILVGTLASNRWQALISSVSIWFILILAWPILLMSILSWLPYPLIKPGMEVLVLFNPAELTRIWATILLGGGSIFGPEYLKRVIWIEQGQGLLVLVMISLLWVVIYLSLAMWRWERKRADG